MHTQDAKARYIVVEETDDKIFIEDVGTGVTITNDAEAVVYELVNKVIFGDKNKRIIYKDSQGNWDELLHDGDQFTNFGPYQIYPRSGNGWI